MKNQLFNDVQNERVQKRVQTRLKPERVQTRLLSSPPSIPPGGRSERVQTRLKPERVQTRLKPERVQFTVNGKAVDHADIVLTVNGRKLTPKRVQFAFSMEKLKPERVQQAFAKLAEAFRYAKRGRLRKALQAFNQGMDMFSEFLDDIWFSLIPSIDIVVAEPNES